MGEMAVSAISVLVLNAAIPAMIIVITGISENDI
jgi:hypothetical protein